MADSVAPFASQTGLAEKLVAQAIDANSVEESLKLLGSAAPLVTGETTALSAWIDGLTGYMLYRSGDFLKARSHFEMSERRWAAVPPGDSPKRRAATLCNYANLLCDLGAYQASRARLEATLDIERRLFGPDDPEYARTLANFARLLQIAGQAEEACRHGRQAVAVLEKSKAPRDKVDALYAKNLLGIALMDSGGQSEALSLFKSLLLPAKKAAPDIYYSALNNVGCLLYDIGDYREAASWEQKALRIVRKRRGDAARVAEATLLTNLGAARHKLGDFKGACRSYDKARAALELAVTDGHHPQMASIRCNWATALYRLGRFAEARDQYGQALKLRTEMDGESHQATADVRSHLAGLDLAEGRHDDALAQAIAILTLPGLYSNPDGVWRIFNLVSLALEAKGQRRLAILFGKEAVEILETMRLGMAGFGRRGEDLFLRSRANGYRTLADQLVSENRLAEAEHVLEKLRAAEQRDLLRRDGPAPRSGRPGFSRQEEVWRNDYGGALARITSLRLQLTEELETSGSGAEMATTRRGIAEAASEFAASVSTLVKDPQALSILQPAVAESWSIDHASASLRPADILLHFFPSDSHFWVLRRDGRGNATRKKIEVDEARIGNLVLEFRHALSDPAMPLDKVKAASLRLYDLLLRPVLDDEPEADARLLLWLDGALRFMPPSALFDGNRYLMEKIPILLFSPFADATMTPRGLAQSGVAGFAIGTKIEGFTELPFAVTEIETIVRDGTCEGLFTGERFLSERFTRQNLQRAAGEFGGLLIATHFVLSPADLARSGLLMGTGELMPVQDIVEMDFTGLSLVTISGCDTGTASLDGNTALLQSFADRLVLRGAGAVLASLWRVADAGSARLITEFYRNLANADALEFAAALAQAQRTMASDDKAISSRIGAMVRGIGQNNDEEIRDLADTDFRHPYYWAPFVLLGNGCAQ